jgi:uncharacterized protein YhdP
MTTARETKIWSRRLLIVSVLAVLLVLAVGIVLLQKALHLENYKAEIVAALQSSLHRRVLYESGDFSFRPWPTFTFGKLRIMDKDGQSPFLAADKLSFRLALLPLLDRRLVLRGVVLDHPSMLISRNAAGLLTISDLLQESGGQPTVKIRSIRVKKGTLRFIDQAVGPGQLVSTLAGLDLTMARHLRDAGYTLKLSAALLQGSEKANVHINGSLLLPAKAASFLTTKFNGTVKADNLFAGHYWPYYSTYVPFRKIDGHLNIAARFKGALNDFTSRGTMELRQLRFDYPQVFHGVLTPKKVALAYAMTLDSRDIIVKSLDLDVDALKVKGSCALKDIPSGDLFIEARAKTSTFRLEEFGGYVPYGIIADDASRYIEQHIKGGTYRLEEGSLIGRVSQIAHMEKGTNYNVLAIRGTVEQGLLSYGPEVPTFNSISGKLAMRGKDFILSGMQAKFGDSPFTLDGRITDYPLDVPCGYPFTMTMRPRAQEVAWLLRQEKAGNLRFAGDSVLSLQGAGPIAAYRLAGSWNLSPASYAYRDLLTKPARQDNQLSFQSLLSEQGAKITAFRWNLAPLALAGSAEYRFGAKRPLAFAVRSNDVPLPSLPANLPRLARYQPAGRARLDITGSAGTDGIAGLLLGGQLVLRDAAVHLTKGIKPLSAINGVIGFAGDSLKAEKLSARLGRSSLTVGGTVTGFVAPKTSLDFSAAALELADLGLIAPGGPLVVQRLKGGAAYADGTLTIRGLSGQVNRSVVQVSGTVRNLPNPTADLTVHAAYLDMHDIARLSALERQHGAESEPSRFSLRAKVHAEAGTFKDVAFSKLRSAVHFEQKILYLEQTECGTMDGTFKGNGRVDFGVAGGPRYQMNFDLAAIDAAQFLQTLGTTRELTGTMSLAGDLTAKGDTLEQITASSLGHIRLKCREGTIRKFALLSKLFSVLNVSQLFTFRLPDMVSGGMPYNEINATFALRDGIVRTDDLFIDSNAMNISMVGQFNLVKREMNVTVGVKPLQTIDKVVSRIPVVGWVLTGKNKSLITTYFEATGSLDNPTVKSITVKSMAKGVFSIFKRLFSLPAKLVTDTGEVLINQ